MESKRERFFSLYRYKIIKMIKLDIFKIRVLVHVHFGKKKNPYHHYTDISWVKGQQPWCTTTSLRDTYSYLEYVMYAEGSCCKTREKGQKQ